MDPEVSDRPTTVLTARRIVTMDDRRRPTATAVAVSGGRIDAVGSLEEVTAALGRRPYTVDHRHEHHVLLPGLIDQHLHPILGASTLATEVIATEDWVLPDRTFPAARDHEEYLERLRTAIARSPDEWFFSWGYHSLWHGELDRRILDEIAGDRPVGIWQRSCHELYVNSAAIERLDLERARRDATDEQAASIDLDRGHTWERGFFAVVFRLVAPMLFSEERLERGLHQMVRYLHQNGVTAFNEPGAILPPGAWDLYERILAADEVPFYSFFLTDGRGPAEAGMTHGQALERAERDLARAPEGKLAFFPKQVKLFADGAIISQLMQMREPYLDADGRPDPHHHGEWLMTPEVFADRAELYWREGFQIHVHVNGDAGLDMVLETVEDLQRRRPRIDHRTVIVHFANSTEDQIDRIAALGAVVSANPYYPVGFADRYGRVGLGPARADVMVRSASVLQRGIPLSFHSDLPMGPSDPLAMMHFAVNRLTESGRVAGPGQRISAHEALRAVTLGAAHSWRKEHELGSVEVGKIANFTVVDDDPLEVQPEHIDRIDVLGTYFEGRWCPVPGGVSRAAAARASRPDPAWTLGRLDGRGCICGVARELARALGRDAA